MVEKTQAQGTTFVHADACNFMEVVQRLTGPNKLEHSPPSAPPPPPTPTSPKVTGTRKPAFKLHDRLRVLSPPFKSLVSPSKCLSQLVLCDKESSPLSSSCLNEAEEEKAIRERRFYLHPSPRSLSSRVSDPELLPLFPLTTPKSQGP
ncbi:putative VQ motif-containing protein/13/19/31/33 [Dioscorea sansibarensis]